jgi:hypothetical protein
MPSREAKRGHQRLFARVPRREFCELRLCRVLGSSELPSARSDKRSATIRLRTSSCGCGRYCGSHKVIGTRQREKEEVVRQMYFLFLLLVALMLGMLIFMVDSSPGWDDTGVSAAMVLVASGLMGAIHPARAWVWALAVGLWVPLMGLALDPAGFHPASVLALAFATVGANAGAIVGRFLAESNPAR